MQNKLIDLNNHLFMQIERLGDEGLSEDVLKREIQRSTAMSALAKQVVGNAALALKAAGMRREGKISEVPKMIGNESE